MVETTCASTNPLGLVLVVTTVEPDPQAECYGHERTHEVERLHWLTEADEGLTIGQALHRYGLDEGDRITIRFATLAEERAELARLVSHTGRYGTNVEITQSGSALALRDGDGRIVGVPDDIEDESGETRAQWSA